MCKGSGHRGTLDLTPTVHFLHRAEGQSGGKTSALRVGTRGSALAGPRACHGAQGEGPLSGPQFSSLYTGGDNVWPTISQKGPDDNCSSYPAVFLCSPEGVSNMRNGPPLSAPPQTLLHNKGTWPCRSDALALTNTNCMQDTVPVSGRIFTSVSLIGSFSTSPR